MDHSDLQRALMHAFREEAPDLVERMQAALFELEAAPEAERAPLADAFKRPIHSLKGAASAIGRTAMRDLCHLLEEVLVRYRDTPSPAWDLYHEVVGWLRHAVEHDEERDPAELCARLEAVLRGEPAQAVMAPAPARPDAVTAQAGVAIRLNAPAPDPVAETSAPATKTAPAETAQSIRVALHKLESLQAVNGEIISMRLRQGEAISRLHGLRQAASTLDQRYHLFSNQLRQSDQQGNGRAAMRTRALAGELLGEIRSLRRSLFQLSAEMASQNGQLSLLCDAMDDGIRSIRMMPVAPFLETFRVTARETARQLGRKVRLECRDTEAELDRLIIEELRDPLGHIVRNAISHGIEDPATRVARGKPEEGQVVLAAALDGDKVLISISDDGRGFDLERIRRKALAGGLLRENDEVDEKRLLELVCRPGFSTADSADVVSGRGVGMDVVASMVSGLGGTLSLRHRPGQGSTLEIRVPAKLATAHGLILACGKRQYGVLLDTVDRIERHSLRSLRQVDGKYITWVDGAPVAVAGIEAILGDEAGSGARNADRPWPVVIVRSGVQRLAIVVDDIPGEMPMVVKPLGPQFEHLRIYAGGAILPDGAVLPVIDVRQAIEQVAARPTRTVNLSDAQPEPEATNTSARSILVVDDSITTRTLERNILEACGYRVSVATDGVEALDILNLEDDIAMVVTDMEMPRMDGIELCRRIRAGRRSSLPIVMVTSVGDEAEKRKGLEAGADAYIVKGNFQQDHFLSTVRRFLHG